MLSLRVNNSTRTFSSRCAPYYLNNLSNVSNHKAIKNDKLYSQYFHMLQHCLFQGCYIIVFPHWLLILLACLRIELFCLVPSLCSLPSAAPPVGHFLKAEKFISFRETFVLLFQCTFHHLIVHE